MDPLIVVLRMALAFVFAEALVVHLRDQSRFQGVLRAIGIRNVAPVASLITAVDLLVLVALLAAPPAFAGAIALAYVGAVTAPLGLLAARGRRLSDCGCGRVAKAVDASFFARNTLLATGAATIALSSISTNWLFTLIAAIGGAAFALAPRTRRVMTKPHQSASLSRREALKLGASSAAASAIAYLLPSGIAGGLKPASAATLPAETHYRYAVPGADGDIGRTRSEADRLANVWMHAIPDASRVDWTAASVWGEQYANGKVDARFTTVLAPVVAADGRTVATMVQNQGSAAVSQSDEHASASIEQRLQFMFASGDELQTVLVAADGTAEVLRTTLPDSVANRTGGPERPLGEDDGGGGGCGAFQCYTTMFYQCACGCYCSKRRCGYGSCSHTYYDCCSQGGNCGGFCQCCDWWCSSC